MPPAPSTSTIAKGFSGSAAADCARRFPRSGSRGSPTAGSSTSSPGPGPPRPDAPSWSSTPSTSCAAWPRGSPHPTGTWSVTTVCSPAAVTFCFGASDGGCRPATRPRAIAGADREAFAGPRTVAARGEGTAGCRRPADGAGPGRELLAAGTLSTAGGGTVGQGTTSRPVAGPRGAAAAGRGWSPADGASAVAARPPQRSTVVTDSPTVPATSAQVRADGRARTA